MWCRALLTIVLAFSAFILLTQLHQTAYAQSPERTVALSGTVTNGTAGENTPVNLQVSLQFQAESGEVIERVTLTDAGGEASAAATSPQAKWTRSLNAEAVGAVISPDLKNPKKQRAVATFSST